MLPWGLVVVLACVGSSMAADRLTIGQLHKYHKPYQMHSVTIVGKVEEMQAFPPMRVAIKRCKTLYCKAKFVLTDDTGSLPVESLGSCLPAAMDLPHGGDQIELTAMIQVYVPEGQTIQVMKAVVQEIVVLK
ncbi:MAG: hypothetical protein CAF45_013825 [Nitrospira sp. CG24E]|nr:MAG: hypothetical protein CAF45_013825 [Nitrospira sp. CG24E]